MIVRMATDRALMRAHSSAGAQRRRDPLRDAYFVASLVFVAAILAGVVGDGVDGHAYWVSRLPDPYTQAVYANPDGFYYSPLAAQVIAPFTLLPWPVFHAGVTALSLASLYWLVGRWAVVALFLPFVAIELYAANIILPVAVAIVIGLRRPGAWAFPLLTKVTPGIGLAWFALQGEWRRLAVALGVTVALAGVSFLLAPDLWGEWVAVLRRSAGMAPLNSLAVPYPPRLAAAFLAIVFAARTDRAWLIPVSALLATPVIWPATFSLLMAIPRLRGGRPDPHDEGSFAHTD